MDAYNPTKFSIKRGAAFLLVFILALLGTAHAREAPFERLAQEALSYFTPMEGKVTSVSDGTITSDLGTESGIKEGMRLSISREGAPFVHPVTKEKLGLIESHIGRAEVIQAGPDSSRLKVLSGSPEEGDILRLSSALVRLMFYQFSDVDWNVSEEYYDTLKDTGRFELIDTAPGNASREDIIEEARRLGAEVALVLTSYKSGEDLILSQSLLWVEDGEELYADSAAIEADLLAELRIGSELFTPKKEYIIVFDVPSSTSFVEAGDIDGDGTPELLLGSRTEISFHKTDGPLDAALGGLELKGPKSEEFIWVEVYDLDGDGKDEVVVNSKRSERIMSRVYKYRNGKFTEELKGNHFLRVVDGTLYGQKYIKGDGYGGPVFRVHWGKGGADKPEVLDLPKGVNIFDFNFIETAEGERATVAFDDSGRLNLYDEKGKKIWRSPESYGEPLIRFRKKARSTVNIRADDDTTTTYSMDEWSVKDKIHVMGRSAIVVKRIPLTEKAPGLGITGSQVMSLRQAGPAFQETAMIKDISGGITDMSLVGDRAYLLVSPPLGLDAKKLLKGKNPLINKIYIYSLKGI